LPLLLAHTSCSCTHVAESKYIIYFFVFIFPLSSNFIFTYPNKEYLPHLFFQFRFIPNLSILVSFFLYFFHVLFSFPIPILYSVHPGFSFSIFFHIVFPFPISLSPICLYFFMLCFHFLCCIFRFVSKRNTKEIRFVYLIFGLKKENKRRWNIFPNLYLYFFLFELGFLYNILKIDDIYLN
jgi:hypothetical protein